MTIELSRRLFLFGSAAALAAAAVPVVAGPIITPPFFTPVPALAPYLRREILDIMVAFDPHDGPDRVAMIDLIINGKNEFHYGMNTRGCLRWVAHKSDEIKLFPDQTFALECASQAGLGRINMICRDYVDEHDPIMRSEEHIFPQGLPSICNIYDLEVDNSVEARIARKEKRRLAAICYEEECAQGLHPDFDVDDWPLQDEDDDES